PYTSSCGSRPCGPFQTQSFKASNAKDQQGIQHDVYPIREPQGLHGEVALPRPTESPVDQKEQQDCQDPRKYASDIGSSLVNDLVCSAHEFLVLWSVVCCNRACETSQNKACYQALKGDASRCPVILCPHPSGQQGRLC